jgi:hypothetical protein
MTNVNKFLSLQYPINYQLISHLDAVETTVIWLREQQETIQTQIYLMCDLGHSSICVTLLPWNSNSHK